MIYLRCDRADVRRRVRLSTRGQGGANTLFESRDAASTRDDVGTPHEKRRSALASSDKHARNLLTQNVPLGRKLSSMKFRDGQTNPPLARTPSAALADGTVGDLAKRAILASKRLLEDSSALARAARRLQGTTSEAEELTQAVWATFLEVAPRFEGRSQVRTFLLGILRREAGTLRRRAARHIPIDPAHLNDHGRGEVEHGAEANELERAVEDCMAALKERERRAVELKLLEDKETNEVSGLLGISANYLGVLLHRARAHLRHCLDEHFA